MTVRIVHFSHLHISCLLLVDNSTIVSCSKNYMRIDLNRIYYNTSLYSSITLRHSQCPATYTNEYISVGSQLGSCGSTRRDTASEVIYENEVVFKAKASNGMISREFDQKITFACVYNRHGQSSSPFVSVGYRPISSVNATEGRVYASIIFSISRSHPFSISICE